MQRRTGRGGLWASIKLLELLFWGSNPAAGCRSDAGVTKRVFGRIRVESTLQLSLSFGVPEFLKRNAVPQPAEHGTKRTLSLSLPPSITQTHQHKLTNKHTHTPCCGVTLAQSLTDITLGNTLGTV